MVAKYGLQEFIHFAGHRTDMPTAMQELDLLVTLSAGSVIAEAMATGKPVIGTPIGSTAEMIVHGVTGYVIPLDPIEKSQTRLLNSPKIRRQSMRMGQPQGNMPRKRLALKHMSKRYRAFMRDC